MNMQKRMWFFRCTVPPGMKKGDIFSLTGFRFFITAFNKKFFSTVFVKAKPAEQCKMPLYHCSCPLPEVFDIL